MIQPVKEKIILGIDPGTTIMGYGILRIKGTKPEMVAMGIIDLRKFANDAVTRCFPPPIAKNTHFLLPGDLISGKCGVPSTHRVSVLQGYNFLLSKS